MKPADRHILDRIAENKDAYVVFTSTNNITEDDLGRLADYYNIEEDTYDIENIDNFALLLDEYLSDALFNNKLPEVIAWQDTIGYYNNKLNPNSFILLVDSSTNISKFVDKLNERVPEDETIVFLASSKYITFKKPVDHCTYIDGKWIKYNTRDIYKIKNKTRGSYEATSINKFIDLLLENVLVESYELTREDILMRGYELSGRYYDSMSFKDRAIEKDDFKQEAYFILAELYDSGDPRFANITQDNLNFTLNQVLKRDVFNVLRRKFRRDYQYLDLDEFYEDPYKNKQYSDIETVGDLLSIGSEDKPSYIKTPEEQYEYDNAYGKFYDEEISENTQAFIKDITEEFAKHFSDRSYKGRRYIYIYNKYKNIPMSPRIIVTLLLAGFSLNDLLEAFMPESDIEGNPIHRIGGKTYASHNSPGSFIRDKFHLHRRELTAIIKREPLDKQVIIYELLLQLFEERKNSIGIAKDDEFLLDTLMDISLQANK